MFAVSVVNTYVNCSGKLFSFTYASKKKGIVEHCVRSENTYFLLWIFCSFYSSYFLQLFRKFILMVPLIFSSNKIKEFFAMNAEFERKIHIFCNEDFIVSQLHTSYNYAVEYLREAYIPRTYYSMTINFIQTNSLK